MPRPRRICERGQIVHLTARVVDRAFRFKVHPAERAAYLGLLQKYTRKHKVQVFAFCLMDNHVHLLLRQGTKRGTISNFMHDLQGTFARGYNRRHGRKGHFWEERFHQVVCASREALLMMSCYIHLNPVTAGLVARPEDWSISSARVWLGLDSPYAGWISLPEEYGELRRGGKAAAEIYRGLLDETWIHTLRVRRPVWTRGHVVGSRERVEAYVALHAGRLRTCAGWRPCPIAGTPLYSVRAA